MKIALVSSLYGIFGGGAGLAVQQLAESLPKFGHEVIVITTGHVGHTTVDIQNNVKIIAFRPASFYIVQEKENHPFWQKVFWQLIDIYNPFTGYRLDKILQAEKPDIIHIHKMRGLSGAVWTAAAKITPGRVVQTCHDFESISPMGTLAGRVGQLALNGRWPLNWYQALRSYLSRPVHAVTAPGYFTLSTILNNKVFPSARSYIIANTHGLSLDNLEIIRHASYKSRDSVVLLYLGRLEPEKGLRELCSAFVLLSRRFPSLRLIVAGWGSLETELHESYGKYPNIEFTGKVLKEEKAALLSYADIVVIPSTGLESFGMVAIEAFAHGKPVIAAKTSGLAEIVREGETGWFVQPGSIEDLVSVLEKALLCPEIHRMSTTCFEEAKLYTIETMTQKYLRVYSNLEEKS